MSTTIGTTKFPQVAGWVEYVSAIQAYDDLDARSRTHAPVLEALERGAGDHAAKADDTAQATALRSGRKDPGRVHTAKWKADLEAARNLSRVLAEALAQQEGAVLAMLSDDPEQASQFAQEAAEAAREAYAAMLDSLLEVRGEFWRAAGVVSWLTTGRRQGRRYKGTGAPLALVDPRHYRSGAEAAEPMQATRALAGFRAEVEPSEEPSRVAGYRIRRTEDLRGYDDPATGRRSSVDSVTFTPIPVDAGGREIPR